MSRPITWEQCTRCSGAGAVPSPIEEGTRYTCNRCGGHGRTPAGDGTASFYNSPRPRIALLSREDANSWRVTFFDRSGPFAHYIEPADRIMDHLRGYRPTATAARLLDYWATRPQWEHGIKAMRLVCYWSGFCSAGRVDLARQLDNEADTDRALALAARLRREHLPELEVW